MKVFSLFVLVVINYSCELVDVSLSIAFENITRHLFELETRLFIDNYGVDLDKMTYIILKSLNKRAMPFQLTNKKLYSEVQMNSSALVTFKSFDQLRKFNDKLGLTNKYYKPLQLFLFCQDATVEKIESLSEDVAQRHKNSHRLIRLEFCGFLYESVLLKENTALTDVINHEYFLVEEGPFIKLLTFLWYSPVKCGELQLIEVNKFNMELLKWENENFSMEKVANFYGCEIFIYAAIINVDAGFAKMLPNMLAANLNYQLKDKTRKDKVDFYEHVACYDTQNNMKNFDRIYGSKVGKKNKTNVDYFISWPVSYISSWMAVPPSENHSEYDKLAMPFDEFTWILIAFTFIAAFVTILILYCVSKSIRDFVIGPNVTTPSLNILQIFFGIGLIVLPRRNFARFLTMLFILYCLIIRTAWQGKMFEFMTKDVPKPEIQTAEEMIEGGYDFYMERDFREKYPESEIAKRGKIKSTNETFNMTYVNWKSMLDPNFKGVLQINTAQAVLLMKSSQGTFGKRLREQVLTRKMCGMTFMSHHLFTGIFDLKSQQMFTAGIVDVWNGKNCDIDTILNDYKRRYKIPPDPPQVLNLKKLEPGFVIFSLCLLSTIFVFLLELCSFGMLTVKGRHEIGLANLAMDVARVAIAVVPEIEDVELDCQEFVLINCLDEPEERYKDAELVVECEHAMIKPEDADVSNEPKLAKAKVDIEANELPVVASDRRDSIDDLIKASEIECETTELPRAEAEDENRRNSIDDLLESLKI